MKEHKNEGMDKIKKMFTDKYEKLLCEFSRGFLDILKYKKYHTLFLTSNIKFSFIKTLKCFKSDLKYKRKPLRLKHLIFNLLSSLIPLFIKKMIINLFTVIIVPTNYLKKVLGRKDIHVVPFGIDIDKFKKTHKGKGIAFFGANASSKGFEDLYNAVKYIKGDIPIRFYFSTRSELMKKKFKDKRVEVYGVVDDIVKAYNDNNIIVLPFRTENSSIGIPITLLEAMSCERCVITTDLPHIKEILGTTGVYVSLFSPQNIANAINLLDDNIINTLGKMARKKVLNNYTDKIMFKKFEEVMDYEKIQYKRRSN